MIRIQSRQNAALRHLARLGRERKYRRSTGEMLCEGEKMLQEAMHRVMEGRTSFVIAHRLSTIRSADLILVINDGDIVEQGTHEELMQMKGRYAQMFEVQSSYYDERTV